MFLLLPAPKLAKSFMTHIISGIQQVGIGVKDVNAAFAWYNRMFGMDIPVFEEAAEATLMLPYTGGQSHSRHAILAINLKGGGGFEIWQYTSRTPQPPPFTPVAGDLGIFCAKLKCDDLDACYAHLQSNGAELLGSITDDPAGRKHFFVKDPYGNHFEITESDDWFARGMLHTGGPSGVIVGVSDMDRSLKFYSDILGYNKVVYDKEGVFPDLAPLPGGDRRFRRALVTHAKDRVGPFSGLLGRSSIELVQSLDHKPRKIYEGRYWGDLGFIHLCFDIRGMQSLRKRCEAAGHPFTVDGGSGFEMGDAAGHFTYIEDPDGTLIEFVETKKVPIMKKFGWFLDLTKRDPARRLPAYMLKSLRFNRRKP
jgi:catechol 2,3-dioxygenase-like lactoylglutathione lyase family enzyme